MCTVVTLPNGVEAGTVGELEVLIRRPLTRTELHGEERAALDRYVCLCGVDVGAVLDAEGIAYDYDHAFGMYEVGEADGA
jgi:hypothetical protein